MDAAKDGDTIIVYSGTYTENIDVNKELTIISESGNPEDTVVQAPGWHGKIFNITANNVTINGFKVEGGDQGIILDCVQYNNISNNKISCMNGIVLGSSSYNTLHNNNCGYLNSIDISYSNNNLLSNNSFLAMEFCFFMRHSNNNILIGNSIHGEHPFLLEYSCNNKMYNNSITGFDGTSLFYSSNNTMSNNYIGGGDAGISVSFSNNTTMSNNYVSGDYGIIIGSSNYCIMSNNTVSAQGLNGFSLSNSNNNILKDNIVVEDEHYSACCSFYLGSSNNNILTGNIARQTILDEGCWNINLINSSSNLIYNNYFNSTKNVYDNGNNIWNITKTPGTNIIGGPFLGGNYWSDYAGADTDLDGLGDTRLPYDSEGQIANGGDYLPLIMPAGPPAVYTVNNSTGPAADYTSIQAAVNAAKDRDTIIVYSGIYPEDVDVNKELTIISQSGNPEDTVVQTFKITANNVTINGFVVKGYSGIRLDGAQYNNISNNEFYRISLRSSSNNTVRNNSCEGASDCFYITYSNNNLIINNSFLAMELGIYMLHSNNNILIGNSIGAGDHGLVLYYSHNNTVSNTTVGACWEPIGLRFSSNNIVSNNYMSVADTAIFLHDSCNNNTVSNNYVRSASVAINLWSSSNNNTVSNNYVGHASPAVNLRSSSNNRVNNNTVNTGSTAFNLKDSNNNVLKDNIANNADFGTKSSFCLESSNYNILTGNVAGKKKIQEGKENIHLNNSNSNLIYNNYFNSANNVYDNGNNIWNITKTPGTNIVGGPFLGGNYWSDYAGDDTDGDGLGDTLLPYNCEGQIANGGDYLPLVTTAGSTPSIPATVESEGTDTSRMNYRTSASRSDSRLVTRSAPAPDSTVLSFDPETALVIEGEGTEIRVMADEFPEGLAGYNLTFSIEDPEIAEITEIEFPVWANLTASSDLPAASVYMTAFDGDEMIQAGAESVILGNLTVSGKAFGKTNLTITVEDLDDDSGNPVEATVLEGSIEVKMALIPEYGNSPENPDTVEGYKDFTGNEEISSRNLEMPYSIEWIKENMLEEFFDFNGDGKIDFNDIVALFKTG
ncbi:TPA: hypothetical protein HA351_05020 [Methanosarcinaceae archaeon]|nr:hypothetical protein [Methanosarcinaceae archaeon]